MLTLCLSQTGDDAAAREMRNQILKPELLAELRAAKRSLPFREHTLRPACRRVKAGARAGHSTDKFNISLIVSIITGLFLLGSQHR